MLKELVEQRNDKADEMENILNNAQNEKRAMNEEELNKFNALEKEIANIDNTISAEQRAREKSLNKVSLPTENKVEISKEDQEVRAFANTVRQLAGKPVEERANLDFDSNGAIIPETIAKTIIEKVTEISPIYASATHYNVKGTLKVPYWDTTNGNINVDFADEFTELTSSTGKFASIDLSGYLVGALTLIGESVVNNSDIQVVNFIVTEMAKQIAIFIEKQLILGQNGKTEGATSSTNVYQAPKNAITMADLIKLQSKVPTAYQKDAYFIMNPETFTSVCLLTDETGRPLVMQDYSEDFPYRLLGRPVYLSDNMPVIGDGTKSVLYGDFSGLAVNFRENISIKVLLEKYATQHAIGIVSWLEFDCKVVNAQKIAVLENSL